jgi:hypothetical protein
MEYVFRLDMGDYRVNVKVQGPDESQALEFALNCKLTMFSLRVVLQMPVLSVDINQTSLETNRLTAIIAVLLCSEVFI